MTERLYFLNDGLLAEVDVCACTLTEDGYLVELRATPFHPQGGGQPSDGGWIGPVEILRVTQEGDRVLHLASRPVPLGRALARVDESRRRLHSRLHSAGHLIGHIGELHGWKPVKAHHWPNEGRIEFIPGPDARPFDADQLQTHFVALVATDLPLRVTVDAAGVRQVRFGDDVASYACGGTHVRTLTAVGSLASLGLKERKGRLLVSYDLHAA